MDGTDDRETDSASSAGAGADTKAADTEAAEDAATDAGLNGSVHDMIALLETEIERLKASLDVYQQSTRADRRELIRQHVEALDERQDALEELQRLVAQTPQADAAAEFARDQTPDTLH